MKISDHKHETSGEGLGVIEQAKLGLFPLKEPIRIRLLADEKGFHFLPLLPKGMPEKPDGVGKGEGHSSPSPLSQ